MINKERYNFDQRLINIAEKVLSFNGIIPSNIADNSLASKPHDYESYMMKNDTDYKLLKEGNFYTGTFAAPSSYSPFSPQPQPTQIPAYIGSPSTLKYIPNTTNQQLQPYISSNSSRNINLAGMAMPQQQQQQPYQSPVKSTPALKRKRDVYSASGNQGNNLFQLVDWKDSNKNSSIPLSHLHLSRLDQQEEDRKLAQAGEMIAAQQRQMMEMMNAQHQQQLQAQMLAAELARNEERKANKKKAKDLSKAIEPLLENQSKVLNALINKVEQQQRQAPAIPQYPQYLAQQRSPDPRFADRITEIFLMEQQAQAKRDEMEYQARMQMQAQDRMNQDQNLSFALAMLNAPFQAQPNAAAYPLGQQQPNMLDFNNQMSPRFPVQQSPFATPYQLGGGMQSQMQQQQPQNQQSQMPLMRDMQSNLFAGKRDQKSAVIQDILQNIKRQ